MEPPFFKELVDLIGISGQSFALRDDLDPVSPVVRDEIRITPTPETVNQAPFILFEIAGTAERPGAALLVNI
jgi:hypothetical protein